MNIGSLYLVRKWYWLLFPTKETAAFAAPGSGHSAAIIAAMNPLLAAANWSRHYKCEITYFSPESYILFLEEEGKLKKVLTSTGKLGWVWFDGSYNDCFEEVKIHG